MGFHRPNPAVLSSLSDAAIPTIRLTYNPEKGAHEKWTRAERFICGPISFAWMKLANKLPGKTSAVALSLWFLNGVKRSTTFAVSAEAITLAGCSRQAYARSLNALAEARLISLERRSGKRPLVTMLGVPLPPADEHLDA